MKKKIIISVDGSALSLKALDFAISMAKAYGDEIHLLNIQEHLTILGENVIREAINIVEQANVGYSSKIRTGTPSVEIVSEAKDDHVRCIIMGSRGAGKSQAGKLGSVSESVLKLAPCPVIIVPA